MIRRLFIVTVVAMAFGCASTGPEPAAEPEKTESFKEAAPDPGLNTAGQSGRGADASSADLLSVYFGFDDHGLGSEARAALKRNADVMSRNADLRVTIQGNADERGSEEYNLALGQKRADSARRYLIDLGVAASRVGTVSFGEENPAIRGHNETAWAKNRRDDFVAR
ncbi:MAG: peptidoglycan-associated lipoprotein Pal [bacterium]|nr:peptidoglycan-associated lipoprotein Pal [bacterium]